MNNSLPLNAFQLVRPRGKSTAPTPRPKHQTIGPRPSVSRVLNSRGILQAPLAPNALRSIHIESREQSQASADKRRRISKAGTK